MAANYAWSASRGVHKANFLRTIEEFNKAVDEGKTAQLTPPKMANANKIATPPFYAIPATAGISFPFGGLKINTKADVLGRGDIPIPGLYAAGSTGGGLHSIKMFAIMSSCSIFGRIAGKNAAAHKPLA